MSEPERLREVGRWLRFAEGDLRGAEILLERRDILPHLACFHAQQAAEKAIKGSLIFLQTDFPKTHNLRLLCELLPDGWTLAEDPARFSALSFWAVEPRYPGDLPEATEEDAKDAVEEAREACETTLEDLERHGYTPPREG